MKVWGFTAMLAASTCLATAAAAVSAPAPRPAQQKPQSRPNIIFIIIDDLGWNDLGHTSPGAPVSRLYETPAIDQLAREGVRFTNAHAAHPRCGPSRYAIMTGRFPARGQVPGGAGDALKPENYTIAEALRDNGYATFIAGKWHLGKTPGAQPQAQGFDMNVGAGSTGATLSHFFPYSARRSDGLGPGLDTGKPGEYLADRLTDETVKFIDQHQRSKPDQPFMIYLSHYGVHTPLQGKPELVAKFTKKVAALGGVKPDGYLPKDGETKKYQDNAVYAAMVASIDESVARVRAALTKAGIADNTMIVFTSDNGGLSNRGTGSRRQDATSNLPLRAGKGHLYEGGTTIPMIVHWPGHVKAGSVTSEYTVNTDHYPTLLTAAGLPVRPKDHIDGVSYLPLLTGGKAAANRISYWYNPLPRIPQTGDRASGAIREGNWKYYLSYDPTVPSQLFDLTRDPYEKSDLSAAQPARVAALKQRLETWLGSFDAVEPQGRKGKGGRKGARNRDAEDEE